MNEAVFVAALAVRTAVIAGVAIVGLRLLGKRQLGQMNIYDLAMVMALANAVQNAMTRGSGHLLAGLVSAGTLLAISAAITAVVLRLPRVEGSLVGSPTLLVYDGRLIRPQLRRQRVGTVWVGAESSSRWAHGASRAPIHAIDNQDLAGVVLTLACVPTRGGLAT